MGNTQPQQRSEIGMVGMGVMGRNLALNMADHGCAVAGHGKDQAKVEALRKESAERNICGAANILDFIALPPEPRAAMMLVPAGPPVDLVKACWPKDTVGRCLPNWWDSVRKRERIRDSR